MSGSLTAWFPERLTTQAGVSGVASSRAITASTPILLPCKDTQQQLLALPETAAASVASPSVSPESCRTPTASLPSARVPKWWCGCQSRACRSPAGGNQHPAVTFSAPCRKHSTLLTFLIWSDVIGLPSLDMAPSATMITLRREPRARCCKTIRAHV